MFDFMFEDLGDDHIPARITVEEPPDDPFDVVVNQAVQARSMREQRRSFKELRARVAEGKARDILVYANTTHVSKAAPLQPFPFPLVPQQLTS